LTSYHETFAPAIIEAGFQPYRVDEDRRADVLITSIEDGIRSASVCLADITTDNPNVWFELGFALAVNRSSGLKSLKTTFRSDMAILVNFMNRDGWNVHCLAPDCQTLVSQWVTVRTEGTLLRLLKASGAATAELEEIERDIGRWGRGSTLIDVNETGRQLLRILPQP
jgi:hypothetical protein